nr:unnamed protein product [Callosobruchus chinensis]
MQSREEQIDSSVIRLCHTPPAAFSPECCG